MDDPLKFGIYVLLLLPGFIFVQTREYHLLREKRSQLEKSLEILLWSAILWVFACTVSFWWPFRASRAVALCEVRVALRKPETLDLLEVLTIDSAIFFGVVCMWSFLLANTWGLLRKRRFVDAVIYFCTGRDWYPSVALKFFDQNIDRAVVVETTNDRYLGVLHSAPDSREDSYIILSEVSSLPKRGELVRSPERLEGVRWVLIRFDDILEIQALKPELKERS